MTVRVAIYARVSTARQAEQDISIPDQIAQCERHATERGWMVAKIFRDDGKSARNDNRPAFKALIKESLSATKPWSIILVHSFSRYFRDVFLFESYRRQLDDHSVSVR